MKVGRSLTELAVELERQREVSRDLSAPTSQISMTLEPDHKVELQVGDVGHFGIKPHAHDQLGSYLQIPSKYYDRMLAEEPMLLTHNVNTWLTKNNDQRLIRTLDGDIRGWLSNRYRVIDNLTVAESVLPVLMEKATGLEIVSCEVTEQRMYLKAVNTRLTLNVKKGDAVQSGIVISNSEVGCGAFKIEPLIYILVCDNGAILPDAGLRKFHIGRQTEELENAVEVFMDDTRAADDKALMLKMRDVVSAALDEAMFRKTVERITVTANNKIEKDIDKVMDNVIEVMKISDKHRGGLLTALASGGDLSQWGLSNALTLYAQKMDSYEDATTFERLGGEVIMLNKHEWQTIAA